ncbi:hypothetical protein GLOIN_2v1525056 [Rhizophagus irregularis DAOM 181602=DAOM 197198]|uniref:Uncharacterized protein n=1 Tax=Rhizophagus irregularis (strain DAOM 181602 / DAOM 197198 / MUCL 43194) TaxID=747089 RepID=A0A2P4QPY9_RHIID|nr:hypothetical protein GLOIN_2v1525056 [Rhizophagus irregularis DAOM 181602=DAOM 197198]POG79696.1 hypothetical protein GLOIN_2v1525056 [Rhizophagus irregularis DAOM 181602=DAOM 197198]|eukprot:XP_025186562.1 hypothetical protein GLOIN_2v1525056 [Rhizophagus irregularis DAOM 181602=DAOM 197198]
MVSIIFQIIHYSCMKCMNILIFTKINVKIFKHYIINFLTFFKQIIRSFPLKMRSAV